MQIIENIFVALFNLFFLKYDIIFITKIPQNIRLFNLILPLYFLFVNINDCLQTINSLFV